MKAESEKGSLDSRREFLTKFLKTKLVQLKDITAAARPTGRDVDERKKTKTPGKKVRFGDKMFLMQEMSTEEMSENEVQELKNFENVFVSTDAIKEPQKKIPRDLILKRSTPKNLVP